MPTRKEIVTAARDLCGIPFRPAGSSEAGCNCLGVWVVLGDRIEGLEELAETARPFAQRAREPRVGEMLRLLTDHLIPIPVRQALPADLLLYRSNDGSLQHLAMISDREGYVIEASDKWKRVLERPRPVLPRRAFQIPGVVD